MNGKSVILVLILAALLVHSGLAQGKKGPKPGSDLSATTSVRDADSQGNALRIQSDLSGNYVNGSDSVESIIQAIGDWVLDTRYSPGRSVYLDLNDPVDPNNEAAPFGSAYVHARMISKCASVGFKMIDLSLGETRDCPLAIAFDYGGNGYRINLNPANTESDYVRWNCTGVNPEGKCASWTMTPSVVQPDGTLRSRGQLIKLGTNRRNPDQLLGDYYLTFNISVSTP